MGFPAGATAIELLGGKAAVVGYFISKAQFSDAGFDEEETVRQFPTFASVHSIQSLTEYPTV